MSLAEIAALNVRYEILYDGFGRTGSDGCTSFALTPEKTGGPPLLGQNWDWIPGVKGALVATRGEVNVLGFTEAGIFGPKLGLNSAGLELVISGLASTNDDWSRLGVPFHARCFDMLRGPTLDAAARAEPRGCSANFLLARTPAEVRLEVTPHTVCTPGTEAGALVHANHFSGPAALSDPERLGSVARQRRLGELFSGDAYTLEDAQSSLQDTDNAPDDDDAICRHSDPGAPDCERYATVVSAVIDLSERALYISDGPPDGVLYQHIALQAVSGTPA